jgi:hypothetical protein
MKRKVLSGLLIGVVAGIIDVTPMIIQKITWDANLSAFSMWIVIGFFLAVVDMKIKGFIKGLVVSYITIIPTLLIIGSKEPKSLIPILIMTTILGATSGYVYEMINSSKE